LRYQAVRQAEPVTRAARGAIGGAAGEIGSAHRAGAAALIVAYGLAGREVEGLYPGRDAGPPLCVRTETDDPVDDVLCECAGRQAWIQAKHSLVVGAEGDGLAPVVAQWTATVRDGLVRPGDALVLAVGGQALTKPLLLLRSALQRRRDDQSGNLTAEEQNVLSLLCRQIKRVAPDLDNTAHDFLLDAAVVWHVDASDAENCIIGVPVLCQHAQLGAAILYAMTDPSAGPKAFAALTTAARSFARRRSGADMLAWFTVLRDAGVTVLPDCGGPPAARFAARAETLGRYRNQLAQTAATLSLSNLGMSISRLPCPQLAEGIRVEDPAKSTNRLITSENGTWSALLPAIRRRSRSLLRGLPGSGKSVALAQIAGAWAADPRAPLPLYVSLQPLVKIVRDTERLVINATLLSKAASLEFPEEDRDLLVEELIDRLNKGQVVVLLDGLDECRDARHVVAESLHSWLDTVAHPDTGLVITTRDSAYSSAKILGLQELIMREPADLAMTLHHLLENLADAFAPNGSREDWITSRLRWLESAPTGGDEFWRVPLFAIMLTLLAARRAPATLPTTRARALHQVVQEVTRRWEARHRHGCRIGTFDGALAEGMLIDSFAILGFALADTGETSTPTLKVLIEKRLHEHYGLPPGVTAIDAEDVLALWDEAGVFVATRNGTVTVRARLFAEVAAAISIDTLPEIVQREWIS
jgi:hypothetical protein